MQVEIQGRTYKSAKSILVFGSSPFAVINFRMGLIKLLMENGFAVDVLVFGGDGEIELQTEATHHSFRVKVLGKISFQAILAAIRFIIFGHEYDRIFSYSTKANLICAFCTWFSRKLKPIIFVTGLGDLFVKKGLFIPILRLGYRFILILSWLRGGKFVFQNKEDGPVIFGSLLAKVRPMIVRGSGVNTRTFSLDESLRSRPKSPRKFLYLGTINHEKGLSCLADSVARLTALDDNFSMVIAGKPKAADKKSYEILQRMRALECVSVIGFVRDVRSLIAQNDVLILPSYREGLPRSVLEAFSVGRPVIGSNVPGIRGVVIPGVNGWLFDLQNPLELDTAMLDAINMSNGKMMGMGCRARELVISQFSDDIILPQLVEIING